MAIIEVDHVDVSLQSGAVRWKRLCDKAEALLIQQTLDWQRVITSTYGDEPWFLIARIGDKDIGGLPLYKFKADPGVVFNSVPGAGPMGGVLRTTGLSLHLIAPLYKALLSHAIKCASEQEALSLTVISHPLLNDAELYLDTMEPDTVLNNYCQISEVSEVASKGEFILPNNRERNPGRTIRKARNAGVRAFAASTSEEFYQWINIHNKRHAELGLTGLSEGLLRRVLNEPTDKNGAFLVLSEFSGKMCGGCLFVYTPYCCDAFMLSMDNDYRNVSPNYIVMAEAFIEMERRGIKFFNWQSSPSRKSGVYRFKRQWGSVERPYIFATRLISGRDEIQKIGYAKVQQDFAGHFVVPYQLFDEPDMSEFSKP